MDTTAFYANLNDPDYTWNLTLLTAAQRRVRSRRADNAAIIGGMLETLVAGYAEWRKAETRRVAAVKARATRAINKALTDK
jgi:hypothetical protein